MSFVRRQREPDPTALGLAAALVLEGRFPREQCAAWVEGVYRGEAVWTRDFGGEQFSLGRAFYTHYEEGKSRDYFEGAAASDARVEAHAPGLQAALRDLVAALTGGRAVQRRGWCGPGVHVFPPGGPVSKRGGVVHFDTEGLPARHAARAISCVLMLQPTAPGGGLKVWDVRYRGHDHPTAAELAERSEIVVSDVGDVVVFDSYRLHQIQPWRAKRDRISATVHAAEIGGGLWETWF